MDAKLYNGLSLAYLGDVVYEIYIRKHALSLGLTKVNSLHKKVVEFTSGEAQAKIIRKLIEMNELSDEEIAIYKRGRNTKSATVPKNANVIDYRNATGFEALIGYLYLTGNRERLFNILEKSTEIQLK